MLKNKQSKKWLIGICALVILSGIAYLNINRLYVAYYYLFKMERFEQGDKLFLRRPGYACDLMRLVRPLTEDEVDQLYISDVEKAKLKRNIRPSSKPYLIKVRDYLSAGEKHDFVAIYQSHEILYTTSIENTLVLINVFNIKPTKNSLILFRVPDNTAIPNGYTFANNNYYADPDVLRNTRF